VTSRNKELKQEGNVLQMFHGFRRLLIFNSSLNNKAVGGTEDQILSEDDLETGLDPTLPALLRLVGQPVNFRAQSLFPALYRGLVIARGSVFVSYQERGGG